MRICLLFFALASSPALADYSDDFTNLNGWEIWNPDNGFDILTTNGELSLDGPSVLISERNSSGGGTTAGIQKRFEGLSSFYISFDWRAFAVAARHSGAYLEILDADSGERLYRRDLIRGGLIDTQWQHFIATDLSFVIQQNAPPSSRNIYIRLAVRDAWVNNYAQNTLFDNFELVKSSLRDTTVVPMERDDLSQGPAPWRFANPVGGCAEAMSMRLDEDVGNDAPALLVEGSYTYTGNITCRWGMRRQIPVAFPFILQFDWAYDTPTRASTQLITVALLGERDRVLFTESFEKQSGWQNYRPFDLSEVMAGHDRAELLIYGHASSDADEPSHLWIDNAAWTQPCDTPFMLYADPDDDGVGDRTRPHPLGAVFCHEMFGWVAYTGACEDTPAGQDNDGDGYSICDGDCDDNDARRSPADRDGDGFSTCQNDCDDDDDGLTPNDADDDGVSSCDGDCDDSNASLNMSDADNDGFTSCSGDCDDTNDQLNLSDFDGDGVTTCAGDCDDRSWQIAPGLEEIPGDNVDNNCNGEIDEILALNDAGPAPGPGADPGSGCGCNAGLIPGLELLLFAGFVARRRRRD
jgi:hypothetical protein